MTARTLAALSALMLIFTGTQASAQSNIEFTTGQSFEHKHSHIKLPSEIFGLPMIRITDNTEDQLDFMVNYEIAGQDEILTIYIYRYVSGSVPVWFDRARYAIETRNDVYPGATAVPNPAPFTPPKQATASGLAATYMLNAGRFQTTGLALMPAGEWLVKVRYSSSSLSAGALASRVQAVLTKLDWPDDLPGAPAAAEIAICEKPLAIKGKAKTAKQNQQALMTAAILGSVDVSAANRKDEGLATPAAVWCRDSAPLAVGATYRADGATDAYLIALSDAGRGISVSPDLAAKILADKGAKQTWSVKYMDLSRITSLMPQDRLPPPAQAIEILDKGEYLSIASTWGEKSLTINDGIIK